MDLIFYEVNDEIKPMIFDVLRLLTMQVVTQILVSANNKNVSFFSLGLSTSYFILSPFINGFLDGSLQVF